MSNSNAMVPIAVIMISLNEAHNMEAVLDNLEGWASEVFLVDSYSSDQTVDIALSRGVHVVQRRFKGFGDQWNFAISKLPVTAPWTMKLDPDERLTDELKQSIEKAIAEDQYDALIMRRRLWFMGRPLPVRQDILRIWRTGTCRFSDVTVNEYPMVEGRTGYLSGELEHHDSPDLGHWFDKQNAYTTSLAIAAFNDDKLAFEPKLLGSAMERRMWIKKNFRKIPFRYVLSYLHNLFVLGAWRAGSVGFTWARLRVVSRRMIEDKLNEIRITGRMPLQNRKKLGPPHPGAEQAE